MSNRKNKRNVTLWLTTDEYLRLRELALEASRAKGGQYVSVKTLILDAIDRAYPKQMETAVIKSQIETRDVYGTVTK